MISSRRVTRELNCIHEMLKLAWDIAQVLGSSIGELFSFGENQ
jgi:DNA-binding XRE family transcriptional regulator